MSDIGVRTVGGHKEVGASMVAATETILSQSSSGTSIDGVNGRICSPVDGGESGGYKFRRVASKMVVSFSSQDPENPVNWSMRKKLFVLTSGVLGVLNGTLGSSLPSGAVLYIARDFGIEGSEQLALPISMFLIGYVVGPIICGSLSEAYGRKPIIVGGFMGFMAFTLACAVCQNWASLLVLRLLVGVVASAPVAVVGGLFADIHDDPRERGRVMAYFMAATTIGPVAAPFISGYVAVVSWRWAFWVGLIFAGITLPFVVFMPETYAPILLQRRAKKLRQETGNNNIVAPIDLEKRDLKATLTVTLTRPIRMLVYESIVLFSCLYLAMVYAIFFLFFQAYPVIFQGIYHMSPGESGLTYLMIGGGAFISLGIFLWWDSILYKAKARGASWAAVEEYRRLPLACLGGPLYVIALFWLGWTAKPEIHWVIPALSGIPFGMGFLLIFMAILNYISDAYETFSASAQSAASCTRSIFGAALPIAAVPMFNKLGPNWSCSLLAFCSLVMSVIPFTYIKYGTRIRANSKFCQHLKELKEQRRREEEDEARRDRAKNDEKALSLDAVEKVP
ncbi:membrane transport protein [Coccidioides immitis H538.4]|uniref:Membrane transport protein n=1 Tax=Coccidioides immitis H538.4 TaxID=396776 RepID=A0A0J8RB08_COCIT|nr:membrane transport protein [Coccidioides immitis H538.4]